MHTPQLPSGADLPQSIRLSHSGVIAELRADDLTDDGVVLFLDSAEQSHVEVSDPSWLLHDYVIRMSNVLTAIAPRLFNDGVPSSVLHLGAGALTLPRWIEEHWSQTKQTVVDIEPELVEFVLTHLPMRRAPQNLVADAASVLTDQLADTRFDVVVLDLFNSSAAPAALTSTHFYQQVWDAVAPDGLLMMNLGDDDGMEFARTQVSRLREVTGTGNALLTAHDDVLAFGQEGNLVFAATAGGFTDAELHQIWARGPHPGEILSGQELSDW